MSSSLLDRIQLSEREHLLRQATQSVKWSTLANLAPRIITPVSTIVLAAVLTPADFGTVAVSSLVITLAQIVVGLGMGPAVIHRRTSVTKVASVAFWMSFLVACVMYIILWAFTPWIAQVFQFPSVAAVIRVSSLSLFLFALSSIPLALLERALAFRRLFWIRLVRQVTYVITSVSLALLGAGVWALVLGPLAGAAIETILAFRASEWQPSLSINWLIARSLMGFSIWVIFTSIQSWLFIRADNALAGIFLGAEGLGTYSLGFNLATLFPALIVSSLASVSYSAFCALQDEPQEVGLNLLKLQSLAAAVLFPVSLGWAAVAPPTITLIYGNRWPGLGEVIRLMAIMPGLAQLASVNGMTYRAVGRPDLWTKLAVIALFVLLPLLVVAGPHGLMVFTRARFVGAFAMPILYLFANVRTLGLPLKAQLKALAVPFTCSAAMFVLVLLLIDRSMPFEGIGGWLKLLSVIAFGSIFYVLLLWKSDTRLFYKLRFAVGKVVFGN